jgi:hypothetical protein
MDTTVEDLECGRYRVLNYQYVNETYFVVIMSDSTGIEYRLLINEGLIFDKVANMHELYKKSNYADARMLKQFVFSKQKMVFKDDSYTYIIMVEPENSLTVLTPP